ncbi:MAG: hypothetical protein ACRDTA_07740 [Pseudonocardiaceae bacterium]
MLAITVMIALLTFEMIVSGVVYAILERVAPSVSSRAVFGAFDTGWHELTTFALRFTWLIAFSQLLWVLLALIPLALLAIVFPGPLRRHDRAMRVFATSYLVQDKRYQFANRREIREGRKGRHLEVSDQRIRPYLPSWHVESSPRPAIGIGLGMAAVSIYLLLARRGGVEVRKRRPIQV